MQVDPCNARLLRQHLACAAAELPLLAAEDAALFGGRTAYEAACRDLRAAGLLAPHARAVGGSGGGEIGVVGGSDAASGLGASLHYCGPDRSPAPRVSLRTIDPERFVVVDAASGRVLEEVEASKAFYSVYDGAVYLHQGATYLCTGLDLRARVARVRPARPKYFTSVRDALDVHVTGGRVAYPTPREALAAIAARRGGGGPQQPKPEPKPELEPEPGAGAGAAGDDVKREEPKEEGGAESEGLGGDGDGGGDGDDGAGAGAAPQQPRGASNASSTAVCESAVVTVRFLGYHRVEHGSGRVFDTVELFLPDARWETQASYVRLPPRARALCRAAGVDYREAVHAAAHAVLSALPLFLVCSAGDVATECDNPYDTVRDDDDDGGVGGGGWSW